MAIVLGYDESPGARNALEVAVGLAGDLREALVIVYGVAPPGGVGEEAAAHRAALEETARGLAETAADHATGAGVQVEVELVELKPAQALVEAADRHDARMIVIGSYGEGPLRGAMLGSTSYRVLAASERPVLVVRE